MSGGERILAGARPGPPARLRHSRRQALVIGLDRNRHHIGQLAAELPGQARLLTLGAVQADRQPDDDAIDLVLLDDRRDRAGSGGVVSIGRTSVPVGSESAQPTRARP